VKIVAVNWMEDYFGAAPAARLQRMVAGFHPAIRAVEGTPALSEALGGIESVPATILFDRQGREVLRAGGQPGAIGRHPVTAAQLEKAVSGLR
jgi:hypothetical protein